jgi:hypothetical protein
MTHILILMPVPVAIAQSPAALQKSSSQIGKLLIQTIP